jgi:uncharacterized protein (TIGR02453 family)
MPPQPIFRPELFRFLRELGRNNNKPWFTANKARYESAVQEPAVRFVSEVGPRLARISPHVTFDARPFGGSIHRIYRDTRFSRDKSPYKTRVGILFGHDRAGTTGGPLPGFYAHLAPGESMVAAGMWRPDGPALRKIREAIARNGSGWASVERSGVRLEGDVYARVPPGFDREHRFAAALKQKDFTASHAFRDAEVTAPGFVNAFVTECRRLDPLNAFLAKAVGVPW